MLFHKKETFLSLMFFKKPTEILLLLFSNNKERYAMNISREIDSQNSFVSLYLKEFEDGGLVTQDKSGSKKIIHLTKKGLKIARGVQKIMEVID